MRYAKCQFKCNLMNDVKLPYYKGAVFRNLFPGHFKHVACNERKRSCDKCRKSDRCEYTGFIEIPKNVVFSKKLPTISPPRPFIVEPPQTTAREFAAGMPFDFNLILIGEAVDALPLFIRAMKRMGEIGFGKGPGLFAIKEIMVRDENIFTNAVPMREIAVMPETLSPPELSPAGRRDVSLRVTFKTPLRIKYYDAAVPELPFHVFVRMMLRRISSLAGCYGSREPAYDYKAFIEYAKNNVESASHLEWFDWKHKAARQDKSLMKGSITGNVFYTGKIDNFLPLINACELLHIGKQAAYGMGLFEHEGLT
ncbi:MAG: CRISPR system precrRNA processing endoribonuclease RAMP protein Cas6 [Thermodesulfobacteriota bacterium]|nr:CRISPR system precrRNA processing endoribonuclease RAMP protein Cas6 [Thermodesulfobacteriota bacterium]